MKAVVYVRVSTDMQEREGTSLETQQRECERYCRERGYELLETVTDSSSGGNLDRPGITRVRSLLASKSVDVVVAYAVDRLSRSQNHVGILFDEISRAKARLELVSEVFEDTAVGRFILAAKAFVAEVEREKIAERTQRGRRERAQQGSYMTPRVPYGYRRSAEKGQLEPDPDRAPILRDIFRRFLAGESYRGIALTLNNLGVPSSRGKPWERQTIKKMLLNETYTGVLTYMDVRVEDAIPPLIDREAFERVQQQIAARPARGGGRGSKSTHLLTSLIYCECGSRMHGRTHTKGTVPRVYECSRYAKGAGCFPHLVDAEYAEQETVEAVNALAADFDRVIQLRTDAIDRITADLETVRASLRRNEVERQRAIQAIRDGKPFAQDSAEAVVADRARLLDAQSSLEARIEQAQRDRDHAARMPEEAKKLLDQSLTILERKRILATALAGSRVVVNSEGAVSIE